MDRDLDRARKLCALAADERTPQGERAAAGIQLARVLARAGLLEAKMETPRAAGPRLEEWMSCTGLSLELAKFGFELAAPEVGSLIRRLDIHGVMPELCKTKGKYRQSGEPRWVYSSKLVAVLADHLQGVD